MANNTTGRGKRAPKGVMGRLIRTLFSFYPVLMPVTLACILINAIVSSMPSVFMQNVIAVVEDTYQAGDWAAASGRILTLLTILITMYVISLIAGIFYTQFMAIITQGTLAKLREKMFDHMQDLPIRYFDTHNHGDIMSFYTNDIDTLRQLISQSLPQLTISCVTLISVFCIMMYYSIWLALVVTCGVIIMFFTARYVSGHSSRYFLQQQVTIAKTEGFMEEMMNGQKVVKVFCHEEGAKRDFDKVNDELFENSEKANRYANILMPLLANLGNVMYVVVALVGGTLLLYGAPNVSISGMALSISIVVPFLNMTKQFAGAIGQVSNQVNMVVMGLAGAHRIFELLDEEVETDDGYVTLVNAREKEDGTLEEYPERTNVWAWKHAGRCPLLRCGLCLRAGQDGAAQRLAVRQAGPEGSLCGLHRRRQDHHHQPDQPLLRHCRRQDPLRRHQHQQDQEGRPAPLPGHRAAGHQPVHRHRHGEHPLRQPGCP